MRMHQDITTRSEEEIIMESCSLSLSLGGLLCLQSLGKRGGQVSFDPCPRWSDGGGVRGGGGDLGEPLGSRDLGERGIGQSEIYIMVYHVKYEENKLHLQSL